MAQGQPVSAWTTVQTDAGAVTLVPIDSLRARIDQLNGWLTEAAARSAALHRQADDGFAAAAAVLVPRSAEWSVPSSMGNSVARATALVAQIADNDKNAGELKDQASRGNVFGRLGAWRHERQLSQERTGESAELRALLLQIGKSAPPTTIPEVEESLHAAGETEGQAAQVDEQISATRQSVAALTDELTRREQSTQAMGFDALYEAANLQISGPQPVDSPLLMKGGEVAYLAVPAHLARMVTRTHYVGGSTGFSFPIGHTGIRYRVGSYRGQPVQQQSLSTLDTGTFVLSSQRVAFIGRMKSTSITLQKILHVEVYDDAIAVFQEGRENPDFYILSQPKRAVFLLNWVLGHQSGAKA